MKYALLMLILFSSLASAQSISESVCSINADVMVVEFVDSPAKQDYYITVLDVISAQNCNIKLGRQSLPMIINISNYENTPFETGYGIKAKVSVENDDQYLSDIEITHYRPNNYIYILPALAIIIGMLAYVWHKKKNNKPDTQPPIGQNRKKKRNSV